MSAAHANAYLLLAPKDRMNVASQPFEYFLIEDFRTTRTNVIFSSQSHHIAFCSWKYHWIQDYGGTS